MVEPAWWKPCWLNHENINSAIYLITELLGQAFASASTTENIIFCFKDTTIYPINPEITTDDILPSVVTDIRVEETLLVNIESGVINSQPTIGNVVNAMKLF